MDEFLAEFNAKPILQKEPGTAPGMLKKKQKRWFGGSESVPVPRWSPGAVCCFFCFLLFCFEKTWEPEWQLKGCKEGCVIIKSPCKKWIIETLLLSGIHLEVKPMGICRAVCGIFSPWCLLGISCWGKGSLSHLFYRVSLKHPRWLALGFLNWINSTTNFTVSGCGLCRMPWWQLNDEAFAFGIPLQLKAARIQFEMGW